MTYHGVSPCKVTAGESSYFRNGSRNYCVKKMESEKLGKETHHHVSFLKDSADSFGVGLLLAIKKYSSDDTPQLRKSLNC